MGLSSKNTWTVIALGCAVALGGAGTGQVAAHPMVAGAHPMMRPPMVLRGSGVGGGRGLRARAGLRGARRGYGYGLDGLGLAGFGLDTVGAGFGAPPPDDGGPYPPPLPPPPFAFPPPPPRCPLIIEIGRGLKHKVETHVVSGRPFCSR